MRNIVKNGVAYGDHDKKKNKEPLENDARTTSRSIVALWSAQNTVRDCFIFLKLISFLENSEKMENRSQVDSNCQWLIYRFPNEL